MNECLTITRTSSALRLVLVEVEVGHKPYGLSTNGLAVIYDSKAA